MSEKAPSYSERIKFQAPKPVRELMDRKVRELRISQGEYLRGLIISDARAPQKQK